MFVFMNNQLVFYEFQNKNIFIGDLKTEEIMKFQQWNTTLDMAQEKMLMCEGEDEMISLAERMQRRFPNTIKNKYNNDTFLVSILK